MSARAARGTGGGRRTARTVPVLRRQRDFRWRGVKPEPYKSDGEGDWSRITRQVLVAGSRGAPIRFDVRYFEIDRGGRSSLERHRHAHVVIAVRGAGCVRVGRRWYPLGPLDSCYIEPHTPHQLRNDDEQPFGFLCLVDAQRDRGKRVEPRGRQPRGQRKQKRRS